MKKELKIGLIICGLVASFGISFFLILSNKMTYAILTITAFIICVFMFVNALKGNRSEEDVYKSELNKVLKIYDSILVKCTKIPDLTDKNIIETTNMEDLVDAQVELRKPIYYKDEKDSCAFLVMDNKEVCVFILKQREDVVSPLEVKIANLRKEKEERMMKEQEIATTMVQNMETNKETVVEDNNMSFFSTPLENGSGEKKEEEHIEILE